MLDVSRTAALIGDMGVQKLKNACVAVFGIGGVGSYAAEALARAGVGTLCLIDNDVVKPSNCNRQLAALDSTIGKKKTDVMAKRVLDINPDINVIVHDVFYDADMSECIFSQKLDFVVDAIDSIRSKESLILECFARKIEMISSMGAGNKLYPERFEVIDIFKTK
ncbi:MAG: tRNA threonylcarbamoyladenosine dehydratase, partial [Christensenella sp.]